MSQQVVETFRKEVDTFKDLLFNLDKEIVAGVRSVNNDVNDIVTLIQNDFHNEYQCLLKYMYFDHKLDDKIEVIFKKLRKSDPDKIAWRPKNTGTIDLKPFKEYSFKHKKAMLTTLIENQEKELDVLKQDVLKLREQMQEVTKTMVQKIAASDSQPGI